MDTTNQITPLNRPINWELIARAERCAAGQAVHELANLVTIYLSRRDLPEATMDAAEIRLRAFLVRQQLAFLKPLEEECELPPAA